MQTIAPKQIMPASQLESVMSESMPCDNCELQNCSQEKVACWDYSHYIDSGNVRKRHRDPNTHIYAVVMGD
jgi:hypothetical protein